MSKKNKNTNVNTDAVVNEINTGATEVAEAVEAKVEEAPVEEVKAEEPVETKVEETPEAPVAEEVKAEEKVEEPVEAPAEPVAEPVEEKVEEVVSVEEVKAEDPADVPAPDITAVVEEGSEEGPVDYFIQLNKEPFTDEKLAMVEARLDKYSLSRFVTAEGIVLVGPYLTKEGAINGRRLVIRSGLKGEIVEIPKD